MFITVGLPGTSNATAVVGFDAGRIIDDIVFTYSNSMNVTQIQAFLNSKVSICDTNGTQPSEYGGGTRAQWAASRSKPFYPPFTCLKDYTENGQTAAQIIYDIAQQYQINPQVLIVLLQKEQALITDTWPSPGQYKTATGYGCPDTAPCDSQYYGLSNQLDWSGYMFRAIFNNSPTWYSPYILGINTIYYNPGPYNNSAGKYYGNAYDKDGNSIPDITYCGGSTVNIQNRATQALYDYTPYQPNQASLDAGYGTAGLCGAYGNRNFYLYFTDWFGSTHRRLITTPGEGVYLVENNEKRPFPNEITFLSYSYKWSDITTISNAEFNFIATGAPMQYNAHLRDGHLVTSSSGGMYVVENGLKRPFPNEGTFFSYAYKWSDALIISNAEIGLIPDGAPIQYNTHLRDGHLVTSPSDGMYVVENGLKRPFPNEITFFSYVYKWSDALVISNAEMSLIPEGTTMPFNTHLRDGHLVTSPSGGMYVVENGLKRPFPNEETFFSYSYKWSDALVISNAEVTLIPEGAAMTYNAHFRDGQLVFSSSKGVFLVENGVKRPFPSEVIFFSYSYKWSDIITISPAELSLIPNGTAITPKI